MRTHRNPSPRLCGTMAALLCVVLFGGAEACDFTRNFGDGGALGTIQDGVESFKVAAGATTSCKVTCDSGGARTSLYTRYDGAASILFNDASDFSLNDCNLDLSFSSGEEEIELGWSLSVSTSFTNLVLSCSCSEPGTGNGADPDGGWGCFSESATVQALNKGVIAMRDLQVGDKVLTGNNQYQPVYAFGHYHETQEQEFLRIYTQANANTPLEMTRDHVIFVSNNGQEVARRADSLKVGDGLIHSTSSSEYDLITRISSIHKKGVYMPLTPDGTIMVNDLKASTYISISDQIPSVLSNSAFFGIDSEQTIHHWWLSPYRMLCLGVSSNFCNTGNRNHNEQGLLSWLVLGRDLLFVAEQQNLFFRIVFMAIPVFVAFAVLNFVELLSGPALAPSLIALVLLGLVWLRRRMMGRSTTGLSCEIGVHTLSVRFSVGR